MAYDLIGNGKTVLRGGVGKVFQYQSLAILATLAQQPVVAPTFLYDTTQVTSPSITGQLPVRPGDPNATACLQPVNGATAGEAVISPTCRSFLVGLRNQVNAGGFVNNQPTVDGDRRMRVHLGVQRRREARAERRAWRSRSITPATAGARTPPRSTSAKGRSAANGRVTRLGAEQFDPNGELVPLSNTVARNTNYLQFLQYQTLESLNTDFDSLELGLDKRFSNRWSGRVSYTLAQCHDVGNIVIDSDPRLDYGRCARDNRHAFAASANVNVWKRSRRRDGVPPLLRLSDQRDDGIGFQRRQRQQRSPEAGRRRPDAADSVGGRLEGLRRP